VAQISLEAESCLLQYSLKQGAAAQLESFGQFGQGAEGHIHFTPFDFAHVRAMDFANVGKMFLRPAPGRTQFAEARAERLLQAGHNLKDFQVNAYIRLLVNTGQVMNGNSGFQITIHKSEITNPLPSSLCCGRWPIASDLSSYSWTAIGLCAHNLRV
jgi:hypothetical protein